MKNKFNAGKMIGLAFLFILLTQCQGVDLNSITPISTLPPQPTKINSIAPTNEASFRPTETNTSTNRIRCVFPPKLVASSNIRFFHWSENSEAITYKGINDQIWYRYNIISGHIDSSFPELPPTLTSENRIYGVENFVDAFISPSQNTIIITRGTPEKYDVYYKNLNEDQEHHLDSIRGYIKTVTWFNNEENAIIAMDWQAPGGIPEAYIYQLDFFANKLTIEMPNNIKDLRNVEYLGMTPNEKRLMFVSFAGKDRTVKMWGLLTDEIISTPVLIPLDFQWVSESEFISVGYQNPALFPFVSVLLYDIDDSEITYLADAKFSIDPFIQSVSIAPNGLSIAYIENETDNLYWLTCKY